MFNGTFPDWAVLKFLHIEAIKVSECIPHYRTKHNLKINAKMGQKSFRFFSQTFVSSNNNVTIGQLVHPEEERRAEVLNRLDCHDDLTDSEDCIIRSGEREIDIFDSPDRDFMMAFQSMALALLGLL